MLDPLIEKFVSRYKGYFDNLQIDLKKANMEYLVDEYLHLTFLGCAGVFLGTSFLFAIILPLISGAHILIILPLAIVLGICFGILTFLFFMMYPSLRSKQLDKEIGMNLPFATIYMATVAGAGIPPHLMFKLLSRFKEYGVVAREAEIISTETELFGKDLQSALKRAADRTPNDDFKELLWGMNTIISGGGDLRKFLKNTSHTLMNEFNLKIENFGKQLSMFLELYLTLVVVGSIFFLVMTTILGAMGSLPPIVHLMERLVVYLLVPAVTAVFIFVIKTISPTAA